MLNLLPNKKKMADAKAILSVAASVAATAVLVRTIINDIVPEETKTFLFSGLNYVYRQFSSQLTLVIDEFQGLSINQVFEAANDYLGRIASPSAERLKVSKGENDKSLIINIDRDEEVVDIYDNIKITWTLISTKTEKTGESHPGDLNAALKSEVRAYELTFNKKHREKVLNSYIPFIMERAKAIKEEQKMIQLHTVNYNSWDGNTVTLNHPMTFETLAIDNELKKSIMDDLDSFVKGKDFYRKIGRAWKRGYLLYGPPGTGKSSLIAAMANHLNYDVYDLDLTDIFRNSDLRGLLLGMSNRSILVIEDIDCSIKLKNRESEEKEDDDDSSQNKVTLSGLLNFIDGLWSCCGEERVIIFTTNHKEKLDPALLRPGRMDMHINLSYCTISAFKQLVMNYYGVHQHELFEQIEKLIQEIEVTPAEVAGELIKNNNPEKSLQGLIEFLQNKVKSQNKAKTETDIEDGLQDQIMGHFRGLGTPGHGSVQEQLMGLPKSWNPDHGSVQEELMGLPKSWNPDQGSVQEDLMGLPKSWNPGHGSVQEQLMGLPQSWNPSDDSVQEQLMGLPKSWNPGYDSVQEQLMGLPKSCNPAHGSVQS